MEFPERLTQFRKEKGLTQITLAQELGVSIGTAAMWQAGKRKPQFEMFDKLSDCLNRSTDYKVAVS